MPPMVPNTSISPTFSGEAPLQPGKPRSKTHGTVWTKGKVSVRVFFARHAPIGAYGGTEKAKRTYPYPFGKRRSHLASAPIPRRWNILFRLYEKEPKSTPEVCEPLDSGERFKSSAKRIFMKTEVWTDISCLAKNTYFAKIAEEDLNRCDPHCLIRRRR